MKRLALALSLITFIVGLRFGTFTASGADSYGYVSQATLWLQGRLIVEEPLASEAPWRNAVWALAPLGYRPADVRGTMVPTYSPGLPLMMAAFKGVGGEKALYMVVPLLGALAVWLTCLLGTRLGGSTAGFLGALALLVSPSFLFQLMWPMTDVPVTALWALASVLALRIGRPAMVGAGLACGAAILTRPNLVHLALPVAVLVVWRRAPREGARALVIFGLAMAPGVMATALINQHLYGSPLVSGYGRAATIYALEYFWPNVRHFSTWLLQAQTPFILLALAAPVLLKRRGEHDASRLALWGLGFFIMVFLAYAWYFPYEDHWSLRFLLPAFPLLLAASAAAATQLIPPRHQRVGIAAIAILLTGSGLWQGRDAFRVRSYEARYQTAGRLASSLPQDSVILSNLHSGSLRYYANRLTVRYEWLAPPDYNDALAFLFSTGRPVFAVFDEGERADFLRLYGGHADLSWLDEAPLFVTGDKVYFYRLHPARAGR